MSETNEATQAARAKDEFFSAAMYMFHVTGFPQQPAVLTSKAEAPPGVVNSGNRTLHALKRSWKITLDHGAGHLAGMTCINLKSMCNDPSQIGRHEQEKAEGIINYVRMRQDSARQQLEQLRKETPRATDRASFPATMESLPPKV